MSATQFKISTCKWECKWKNASFRLSNILASCVHPPQDKTMGHEFFLPREQ
jgi:hypothetical protein